MLARRLGRAFDLAEAIEDDIERALGDDARVELLERAGGGVARVGELLLAGGLALRVQLLEAGLGQINLAAHFQQSRTGVSPVPGQRDRRDACPTCSRGDAANRLEVGGDVVAGRAVAAGRAAGEDALLVAQVDRHAVDLGLDDPVQLLVGQQPLHAVDELAQFVLRVGVVQAEHRLPMLHRLELFQRLAADALRRGIGRDELRERFSRSSSSW